MTGRRPIRITVRGGLHFQLFLRQIAASVAAILLLASPLAESLHAVFVPHVICAEHGEVVHVERARGATDHVGPGEANPRVDADAAAREANHEHCPVIAASSRKALPRANVEARLLPAPAAAHGARLDVTTRPSPTIDLVLLAPKTSPPISA